MPQARIITQRETIDLHAPWYSDERLPEEPGVRYLTLQQRKKADTSGDESDEVEWVETLETQRYKEHITLYRRLSHGDAKWISRQANIVRVVGNGRPKFNEAEMARLRTFGYLRRVVEVTNAAGEQQPHGTESDFDAFDEPECKFIDEAIAALDEPLAPIIHEDLEAAEKAAARIASMEARGLPIPAEQQVDVASYAAQRAQEHLFRGDQRDLPESSGSEQPALSAGA